MKKCTINSILLEVNHVFFSPKFNFTNGDDFSLNCHWSTPLCFARLHYFRVSPRFLTPNGSKIIPKINCSASWLAVCSVLFLPWVWHRAGRQSIFAQKGCLNIPLSSFARRLLTSLSFSITIAFITALNSPCGAFLAAFLSPLLSAFGIAYFNRPQS